MGCQTQSFRLRRSGKTFFKKIIYVYSYLHTYVFVYFHLFVQGLGSGMGEFS